MRRMVAMENVWSCVVIVVCFMCLTTYSEPPHRDDSESEIAINLSALAGENDELFARSLEHLAQWPLEDSHPTQSDTESRISEEFRRLAEADERLRTLESESAMSKSPKSNVLKIERLPIEKRFRFDSVGDLVSF